MSNTNSCIDTVIPFDNKNPLLLEHILTSCEGERQVDVETDDHLLQFRLPNSYEIIPPNVKNIKDCAKYQIESLIKKSALCGLSAEDEDSLDDGFFICDLNVVKNKLVSWYKLFPGITPFFALKCNPDPMVAGILGQTKAAGFDCASLPEIKLALSSTNGNTKACVYANPQRAEKDLDMALTLGVNALTFDGSEELLKVHRAYQKLRTNYQENCSKNIDDREIQPPSPPNMILRLLVPDEHSSVPLGEKFGAPPNQVHSLTKQAIELGLPIIGVSFHCGSGCHDPQAYGNAIKLAKDAIDIVNHVQNNNHWDYNRNITSDKSNSKITCEGDKEYHKGDFEIRNNTKQNVNQQKKEEKNRQPSTKCWLLDIGGGFPGYDGAGADRGCFSGARRRGSGINTDTMSASLMSSKTKTNTTKNDNNSYNDDEKNRDEELSKIIKKENSNGRYVQKEKEEANEEVEEKETAKKIAQVVTPLVDELFAPAVSGDALGDNVVEENHNTINGNYKEEVSNYENDSNSMKNTSIISKEKDIKGNKNNHYKIISEPGRYFVEAAFALCSRIYRINIDYDNFNTNTVIKHKHYYIAQGVHGVFKDVILCGESFLPIPLTLKQEKENSTSETLLIPSTIHGPSGTDFDIICKNYLLPSWLDIDDWLIFDRMGAYTLSIAARSGRPPIRYVMGGCGNEED